MSVLFVGRAGLGGVQMRGVDIAKRLGAEFRDWSNLPDHAFDAIIVVKYFDAEQIKKAHKLCHRLILDPLDSWSHCKDWTPDTFFSQLWSTSRCDEMIAASPSAAKFMPCKSHVIPHHADPRIGDWYNPSGPVVYAGGKRFLGKQSEAIREACKSLGREFIVQQDRDCWQALKGASLTLSVRCDGEETMLNQHCKPAVKVANAAAAGMPILCTDDPAITSLCDVPTTTGDWRFDIEHALCCDPPSYEHSIDKAVELYKGIL